MKKALRFRKAFFGAKFANKADPATLNRATGVVLVMLGVAILAVNSFSAICFNWHSSLLLVSI